MEFHEKLQELRKRRGLTQEELAQALYVSRTAISKWESGRGYPGIDSLKAMAAFFAVSIDDLLSGDALLTIVQEEGERKEKRMRAVVFGLLDCGMGLLFFLPLFGQRSADAVRPVSLLSLTAVQPYGKAAFLALVLLSVLAGIGALALQGSGSVGWETAREKISLGLSVAAALLFVLTLQPYAAVFTLGLLTIKVLLLIKWA